MKLHKVEIRNNFLGVMYSSIGEKAHYYENKIEEIISLLEVDEIETNEEIDEETERRIIPNYDNYKLDNKIEHTLYENFIHKRPYGFKLNESHIVKAITWKDVLVKTCEVLLALSQGTVP